MSKKNAQTKYWEPGFYHKLQLKFTRFLVNLIASDIKVKRPDKDCSRCDGRGWTGYNIITEMPQICRCVFQNIKQYKYAILNFPNRADRRIAWKMRPHRQRNHKQKYTYNKKTKQLTPIFGFLLKKGAIYPNKE